MWFQIPLLNFHSASSIISYGRDRPQHTHWIIFSLSLIWADFWLHCRSVVYPRIRRWSKKDHRVHLRWATRTAWGIRIMAQDVTSVFILLRWAWQEVDKRVSHACGVIFIFFSSYNNVLCIAFSVYHRGRVSEWNHHMTSGCFCTAVPCVWVIT